MSNELGKAARRAFELEGDVEKAETLYTEALSQLKIEQAKLLAGRAVVRVDVARREEGDQKFAGMDSALKDATAAVEADSSSVTQRILGIVCFESEMYGNALTAFKKSLGLGGAPCAFEYWIKKCKDAGAVDDEVELDEGGPVAGDSQNLMALALAAAEELDLSLLDFYFIATIGNCWSLHSMYRGALLCGDDLSISWSLL